jgi:glycosyltransferase involved in cell wall biosynthesis
MWIPLQGAVARLKDPARFRFLFAGGGALRAALEDRCRAQGVCNTRFLGYQNPDFLSAHFGAAHVGLVTQNPATCGSLVPSKLYAFLAAGRPVIYIGPAEATPAQVIERNRCGWRIQPGDVRSLENLLELLAREPERLRAAGGRARDAFLAGYDRSAGVARILEIIAGTRAAPAPAAPDAPSIDPGCHINL